MLCSQDVLRLTWVTATQKGRAPVWRAGVDHGQYHKQDHLSCKHQAGKNGLINAPSDASPG